MNKAPAKVAGWLFAAAALILFASCILLFSRSRTAEASPVDQASRATAGATDEEPSLTVHLIFAPAQCSSRFKTELAFWSQLVAVQSDRATKVHVIAVFTSNAELLKFWDSVGVNLPATVDPEGLVVKKFGIKHLPARVLVGKAGEVLFKDEYPQMKSPDEFLKILESAKQR